MIEINKIYCGDCIEIMKEIPDGSIDLIVADPPYGISYKSNFRKQKFEKLQNDDVVLVDWLNNAFRVLKTDGAMYCFTRWDIYPDWFAIVSELFKIKNCIVWYKKGGGLGDLKSGYIYNHEFIIYAIKGNHVLKEKRCSDVWEIQKDIAIKYLHPTQKPVSLIEKIIIKSSDINDTILDPFLGSGTTAIACLQTNRNFIGIEIEPKYVEIANKRISDYKQQLKLELGVTNE